MNLERPGEIELDTAQNILQIRASVKKLLEESKWTVLPTEETLEALRKLLEENFKRSDWGRRKLYTEVFPVQEYEYRFFTLCPDANVDITLILDSKRRPYQAPFTDIPHFRSNIHPIYVLDHVLSRFPCMAFPSIIIDCVHPHTRAPTAFGCPDWSDGCSSRSSGKWSGKPALHRRYGMKTEH
ncbi:hypothetical protein PM082_019991 [Marasmius tenuissimus]|nr:hypothetical protein PM082_019991 [Marasmius tenuissimus]